jgi:hypothetical protein
MFVAALAVTILIAPVTLDAACGDVSGVHGGTSGIEWIGMCGPAFLDWCYRDFCGTCYRCGAPGDNVNVTWCEYAEGPLHTGCYCPVCGAM